MLLTIKRCLLVILSPIWRLIGVCLVVFSLLIVGCSGGGGGSSGGGGGLDIPVTPISGQLEVSHNETSALLNWALPEGNITEILIEVRQDGRVIGEVVRIDNVTTIRWELRDLMAGEDYEFRVLFVFSDRIHYLSSSRGGNGSVGEGNRTGGGGDGSDGEGNRTGGGGDGSDGEGNRTGGGGSSGGEQSLSKAGWSVIPYDEKLSIRWHNYDTFNRSGVQRFTVRATVNGQTPRSFTRRMDHVANDVGVLNITDLMNGDTYKFDSDMSLEFSNSISGTTVIEWQLPLNIVDHAANGTGIEVGPDYDRNGWADRKDPDDDGDGVNDDHPDNCIRGALNWRSTDASDKDGDGCRDSDEDDQIITDQLVNADGVPCTELADCDGDNVSDEDEAMGCIVNPDCDGDGLADGADVCPVGQTGWRWEMGGNTNDGDGDGCHNDEDIDDDGNGLIEISTAAELNAVRYQLDGTGRKLSDAALLDDTGCGGAMSITTCNGYELVADIDLSSFRDGKGWVPITDDLRGSVHCGRDPFTGIFDGNGHIVSGLFTNRSGERCVGLFSTVRSATIRDLGVIADNIIGKTPVGGLVGSDIGGSSIIQSFVVADQIRGETRIGGLIGEMKDTKIVQSYAVTRMVHSNSRIVGYVGGLVGFSVSGSSKIVQSYAVSGSVRSETNYAGGLIGGLSSNLDKIIQSYAVSESVHVTSNEAAGLVGRVARASAEIIQSYTVTGSITGRLSLAGFVSGAMSNSQASYWDSETSGINSRRTLSEGVGVEPKTTMELRSPTDYTGSIYDTWDDGSVIDDVGIAALNTTGTIYCDTDLTGMIEAGEQQDDNRVWDLGTASDYPAIRCTPDSLTEQRAWWSLVSGEPQVNRTVLDDWLDGSPP